MLDLLIHELRSRIPATLGWGIGLILFGAMYISVFPEAESQMAGLADLSIYQAMGIDLRSFAGFIASVVLQFIPLLLGIYAILTSTDALAGEEDNGTLELVLAMPLHRWQILTVKAVSISFVAFLILVIAGAGNAMVLNIIKQTVTVDVTGKQLFLAMLSGLPLTMAFIMMGLFLGAYLPNRRIASMVMTVLFIANYFGNSLVGLVESLEPIKPFSLFYYMDTSVTIFTEGVQSSDVLVLLSVAAVFFVLALLSFQRRNVTVGAWPWQRGRVSD